MWGVVKIWFFQDLWFWPKNDQNPSPNIPLYETQFYHQKSCYNGDPTAQRLCYWSMDYYKFQYSRYMFFEIFLLIVIQSLYGSLWDYCSDNKVWWWWQSKSRLVHSIMDYAYFAEVAAASCSGHSIPKSARRNDRIPSAANGAR